MDVNHQRRMVMAQCLVEAPTLLENYMWAWLMGFVPAEQYFEELIVTDLVGPGCFPDDFDGCEDEDL